MPRRTRSLGLGLPSISLQIRAVPAPVSRDRGPRASGKSIAPSQRSAVRECVQRVSCREEYDEMTMLLNEPIGADTEDSVFERWDDTIAPVACEQLAPGREREPQFRAFELARPDEICVPPVARETAARDLADSETDPLAHAGETAPQKDTSFSLGLVDTYYRQMGDAGALCASPPDQHSDRSWQHNRIIRLDAVCRRANLRRCIVRKRCRPYSRSHGSPDIRSIRPQPTRSE